MKNTQTLIRTWLQTGATMAILAAAGALLSSSGLSANAQINDPMQNSGNMGDSSDIFSNRGDGQMNGMFDLIHRATLANPQSWAEFNTTQQRNIESAASEFRSRQLQMLRQRQQQTQPTLPSDSVIVAPEAN